MNIKTKENQNVRNAVIIGVLCSITYLTVYIVRNVLSVVTPQMLEEGFTTEYIGKISSVFFGVYAVGQLINGLVGDRIKARYMMTLGLIFAGVTNLFFPFAVSYEWGAVALYAMTAFSLAMIYAPLMKVISENVEPDYAPRCSLGCTFASYFGATVAGFIAALLSWRATYFVSSLMLIVMGVTVFVCLWVLEKKEIVRYGFYKKQKNGMANAKILLKRNIVKFMTVSIITGIIRTSVMFWLPTYISQYLGFSADGASVAFTVATVFISVAAFIATFTYERLNRNMNVTVLLMFSVSAFAFVGVYFLKYPILNIIMIILAVMASNGAAAMLWNIYCPSLRDTGMTAFATGFLNFLSYISAAVANVLFGNAVAKIGWGNLILVWLGIMVVGVIASIPYKHINKENCNEDD